MLRMGVPIIRTAEVVDLAQQGEPRCPYAVGQGVAAPLYRYMEKRYYDDFVRTGRLRLGTLWSYHDQVKHGLQRGDREEGFRSFSSALGGDYLEVPMLFYSDSVNQWSLCTTRVRDDRFYPDFKADCCIEISSLEFFKELAFAARAQTLSGLICSVRYVDTADLMREFQSVPVGAEWHPPFWPAAKPARYAWQQEVRLLLEPLPPGGVPRTEELSAEQLRQREVAAQVAIHNRREHDLLKRPELHPDLQPLFVDAPAAVKHTRLLEVRKSRRPRAVM